MIKTQRNILHIQFEYNSIIRNRIVQISALLVIEISSYPALQGKAVMNNISP